ncbi:MAG: hypothetical protein Kow0040_21520 [Thermogutta sp.]
MHYFPIVPLLIVLAVFLSFPTLLAVFFFSRRVQRQYEEMSAALAALIRSVEELHRALRPLPSDRLLDRRISEPTETAPPVVPSPTSPERPTEVLEQEPPQQAEEFVEAMIVASSAEGGSSADSPAADFPSERSLTASADAGTVDTLKRIGNWFLFGQERAPTGTSIEVAIAANWLLRIGMLILVLGIAFFLKYSIDRGWIGPFERVLLGTATGLAMVTAGSFLLGGRYRLLAHGLQGGGIVVLYLSVFAAAVFLKLIDPVPVGFALMTCVTALACFLALAFGSPLTAVIGIAGGYATPILLPSEDVQFIALYTYLTILGVGVLGISVRRNWPQLNVLSFLGTYFLATVSLVSGYSADWYWIILFFLTVFFLLFSTIVFVSARLRSRANLFDLGMLWLNALFFFGLAGSTTRLWLDKTNNASQWTASIPLGIAAFYSAHVYMLLLRRSKDAVLFNASLGLAALFVAVAVPIVLSDDWITFAWAAQSLVMLWVALRIDSRLLRFATWILFTITAIRFFTFDVAALRYGTERLGTLGDDLGRFIPRLTALGGSVLCVALAARLVLRRIASTSPSSSPPRADHDMPLAGRVLAVLAASMLFAYATWEIHGAVTAYYDGLESGAVSIWWSLFAIALIAAGMWKSQRWVRAVGLILFAVVTYKVFFRDLSELNAFYRIVAFVILGLVILSGSVLYLRFKTNTEPNSRNDGGAV